MIEYQVSKMPLRNMQEATELLNRFAEKGFRLTHTVPVAPDVILFLEKDMTPVQAEPRMSDVKKDARAKAAVKKTEPKED